MYQYFTFVLLILGIAQITQIDQIAQISQFTKLPMLAKFSTSISITRMQNNAFILYFWLSPPYQYVQTEDTDTYHWQHIFGDNMKDDRYICTRNIVFIN